MRIGCLASSLGEGLTPHLGGLVAAPLAGYITKIAPARYLLGAAAMLVMSLSVWQGIQLWPRLLEYQIFSNVAELAGLTR